MPLKDKEISADQEQQNAEQKAHLEKQFEQHEASDDAMPEYLAPKDFKIKNKLDKKKNEAKVNQNYKEIIFNNISRINAQRTNFQNMIEKAREQQGQLLTK